MCDRCQRNTSQLTSSAVDLQPIPVEAQVWHLIRMDIIGPYRKSLEGNQYILTVTDYFSKYIEAIPICDKTAHSVAKGIYKIYCRHGAPVSMICDQGREFINQVICSNLFIQVKEKKIDSVQCRPGASTHRVVRPKPYPLTTPRNVDTTKLRM